MDIFAHLKSNRTASCPSNKELLELVLVDNSIFLSALTIIILCVFESSFDRVSSLNVTMVVTLLRLVLRF
jgi:hypothetical protein